MEAYQVNTDTQSILVNILGSGLCAKMFLIVKDSDKGIEELVQNKGIGYRGAELVDLRFDIRQDSISTEFIFKEISRVID